MAVVINYYTLVIIKQCSLESSPPNQSSFGRMQSSTVAQSYIDILLHDGPREASNAIVGCLLAIL